MSDFVTFADEAKRLLAGDYDGRAAIKFNDVILLRVFFKAFSRYARAYQKLKGAIPAALSSSERNRIISAPMTTEDNDE